jgi:anti-sigma regulatory factor (Ser/Thr protein kinase)
MRDAGRLGRPVRAFGEMVGLLWDRGDVSAAIELETLWNALAAELPFSLYCAYHADSMAGHEHADALHEVCHLHSALVPGNGDPAEVTVELPVDFVAATQARLLVADTVRRWGHERSLVANAELITSELASNAIRHARTPFRVSVRRYGPMLRISVSDGAETLPAPPDLDPEKPSGRGMFLVDAVSRRWGVDVVADGKTVWAELGR